SDTKGPAHVGVGRRNGAHPSGAKSSRHGNVPKLHPKRVRKNVSDEDRLPMICGRAARSDIRTDGHSIGRGSVRVGQVWGGCISPRQTVLPKNEKRAQQPVTV